MSATIQTIRGSYFFFERPQDHYFDLEEIAHSLSNICRFVGHTKTHYSVAQHSVHVSTLVPRELALAGLMHDASEAYLGDVSSGLKQMLSEYQVIEERVEAAIAAQYGLPHPMPPEIRKADRTMLMTEKRDLLPKGIGNSDKENWPDVAPLPGIVVAWEAEDARMAFLARFYGLTR